MSLDSCEQILFKVSQIGTASLLISAIFDSQQNQVILLSRSWAYIIFIAEFQSNQLFNRVIITSLILKSEYSKQLKILQTLKNTVAQMGRSFLHSPEANKWTETREE